MTRRPRARRPRGRSHVGETHEVVVGPVAHGGHCVARVPVDADGEGPEGSDGSDGSAATRVVFVRHALPGERVVLRVTEGTAGDRFWRADAVQVLDASPDRVPAPCPVSGPDGCGGCDFQHVALPAQRGLKAAVVTEQLRRLAGLEVDVEVEAVPGDRDGLRWRTRQRYVALDPPVEGVDRGMHKHRSREVVPVADCLIEAPHGPVHRVRDRDFDVARGGFWQVHPGAPEALVAAVLEALEPRAGESALDLYAGVGLFSAFLADAVGAAGRVVAVEGDPSAAALLGTNVPGVEPHTGDVGEVLAGLAPEPVDVVVLDPPRAGAKRAVVEQVVARTPRAVAYVACDPAALARDLAVFAEHGYELRTLRAFDLFPMTHHVECVALVTPAPLADS